MNSRIGLRPSTHLLPVSFRHPAILAQPRMVADLQRLYRGRTHTQADLARDFGLSSSLVSKILRVDPKAPRQGGAS